MDTKDKDDITEKIEIPEWLIWKEEAPLPKSYWIKCECGSSKTSHPNIHSDWCPLYKDPTGN